ncbi:MAG TPA: glutathione S-transferase [Acidisphaera sp.]|nr:glutathione S-transferase [Acidisphaera sp.]
MSAALTLFHSPRTRSSTTLILLEELGVPYEVHLLDMMVKGEHRKPEYLAINPMGKVPAIRHGDTIVTEQVAIALYLADAFPQARLAPPIGDPLRGAYLRWLVFYAAAFEPAIADKAAGVQAANEAMMPYGNFDRMLDVVSGHLTASGPWWLGETFSAADVIWGSGLTWTTMFKIVPEHAGIRAYTDRVNARPAAAAARKRDEALQAQLEKARG